MHEREPMIAVATIFILLMVWFGGMIEPSLDFAGSLMGGILAILGTLLLLMPLFFFFIKRIKNIKTIVVRHLSMRTILTWHIYAGFLGSILVLLHTGHKFNSVLATSLTAFTLIVVLSGVIGRYLQRQIGDDVRSKRKLLNQLYQAYDDVSMRAVIEDVILVSSISDVEYAITARETLKKWFNVWLAVHITLIMAMYLMLILHIWSGIHFGIRWFV